MSVVNGFTGSSIWQWIYSFPPVSSDTIADGFKLLAERWNPILDVFGECGVKFALEVHPTEIAFDIYTAERALEALGHREEFGFNFDPSHLIWQGVDPVEFIRVSGSHLPRAYEGRHCHAQWANRHPRQPSQFRRSPLPPGLPLASSYGGVNFQRDRRTAP